MRFNAVIVGVGHGGASRRLTIPGGNLPGVQGVRTRTVGGAMKAASETASQVVGIGVGYIGLEAELLADTERPLKEPAIGR